MKATIIVQKVSFVSCGRESTRWDDIELVTHHHVGYDVVAEIEAVWKWRVKLGSFAVGSPRSKDRWVSGKSKIRLRQSVGGSWPISREWADESALRSATEFERAGFVTDIAINDEVAPFCGKDAEIVWLCNPPPVGVQSSVKARIQPIASRRNWGCE